MKTRHPLRPSPATVATVLALLGASTAWAAPPPPVLTQGGVAFVSGGIGRDEAMAIEAQAKQWPLMLEFAAKDAKHDAFLADVGLRVLDAKKHVVLDTVSDGPFVLVRLNPGRYEVRATFDGTTITRTVQVVSQGTAREVFVWPHRAEDAEG